MSYNVFFILFIVAISSCELVSASRFRSACRCLPSQPCWPTAGDWQSLNSSVEGALIAPRPPAAPCHDPFFDQAACDTVTKMWSDVWWRADQPGALQSPYLEMDGGNGCLFGTNRSAPCLQGAVPVYAVSVSKASQVQAAVSFAEKFNIRLVVKNTGHEMTGKNTAPGSLSLWMRDLKGITFIDSFTPKGGRNPWWWYGRSKQSAVKVGAGVLWEDVYKAAFENGKTVVGAQCTSVGAAGGYPLGGGHSQISPTFGLAADNVLEFEVVTADGKLLVANSYQNQELFWALRGGGGGTFGVVLSVTYTTYPALQSLVFASYTFTSASAATYKSFLSRFLQFSPFLADFGWGGNFLLGKNSITALYLLPNKDMKAAQRSFAPVLSNAKYLGVQVSNSSAMQTFNSYYEWHRAVQCPGNKCGFPSGFSASETSRLLPRSTLQFSSSQVADALIKFVEQGNPRVSAYLVGGGKVSLPQWSAVNPAWRQAILHVLIVGSVPEQANAEAKKAAKLQLTNTNKMLRDVSPWSGSYLNEADFYEPNWQQSFYGRNYWALKNIKNRVDPKGLFICRHCVGSDDWSEDLNCVDSGGTQTTPACILSTSAGPGCIVDSFRSKSK